MSKSGSSQTSTTSIDPQIKQAYLQNLQQAQGVASALPVREFAGFNPIYRAGEQQLVNTGLAGRGIDTTNIAAEYANQAAQFQPYYTGSVNAGMSNQFGAVGYTPTAPTAAQAQMSNISNYMNPYIDQVIGGFSGDDSGSFGQASSQPTQPQPQPPQPQQFGGNSQRPQRRLDGGSAAEAEYQKELLEFQQREQQRLQPPTQPQPLPSQQPRKLTGVLGDIEAARQAAVQQMGEAATRAKAFGGTRQGVAEAATNRAYADKAAQMSAQLRQQGFDTSANLMQQDLNRTQQANLQSSQQGAGAMQFGAAATNQAMMQNAAAQNEMQRYNASLSQQSDLANQQAYAAANAQRLAAAGQLGAFGQQQQNLGLTGAQAVMGAGSAQQQFTQQQLDALRGIGVEKLGITQGAMSAGLPNMGGTTSTPTTKNPFSSALGGAGYGYQFGGLPGAGIGALLGLLG